MIKIYGHSDDIVCIKGDIDDEVYPKGKKGEVIVTVGGEGEGVEVVSCYDRHGCWSFALRLIDEDVPMPWPVRIEVAHSYSLAVVIDCPPGTPVDWDGKDESGAV